MSASSILAVRKPCGNQKYGSRASPQFKSRRKLLIERQLWQRSAPACRASPPSGRRFGQRRCGAQRWPHLIETGLHPHQDRHRFRLAQCPALVRRHLPRTVLQVVKLLCPDHGIVDQGMAGRGKRFLKTTPTMRSTHYVHQSTLRMTHVRSVGPSGQFQR